MPELEVNGTRIYYEDTGRGDIPILFAHGVLWSGRMFDPQVAVFQNTYRCVRLDFRGQGRSAVPRSGYDMETLLEDTVALIQKLELGPVHFVGLSMGGFVGMRLASRRPDLVRSLVLIGSAAGPESPDNRPRYRILNFLARWFGLHVVANRVMRVMFGKKFLVDPNRSSVRREMRRRLLSNHRLGATRAVRGVIERRGVLEEIGRIRCPTFILVGDQDGANTPDRSRQIQRHIGGSSLRIIPGAGHTATIEEPELININLRDFYEGIDGRLPLLEPLPAEVVSPADQSGSPGAAAHQTSPPKRGKGRAAATGTGAKRARKQDAGKPAKKSKKAAGTTAKSSTKPKKKAATKTAKKAAKKTTKKAAKKTIRDKTKTRRG